MKKVFSIASILVLGFAAFFIFLKTQNQIKRTKTFDTFGQILVTLDRTLGTNSQALAIYDPATETKKIFPFVPVTNGQILDAWNRPIKIKLARIENSTQVSLTSFGSDGIIGTKDDLIQNEILLDQSSLKQK